MTELAMPDANLTEITRHRYDRIASIYDVVESLMEVRARSWRRDLWSRVEPGRVLEIGIGTGKNLPYYSKRHDVTGIDISPRMLDRARAKAQRLGVEVQLQVADAQRLPYADASFDAVVSTFVFCSVPDPALALDETRRVLRPGGQLLLLEHVLSRHALLRTLIRWLDPIPAHLWGAHIDRETARAVHDAGFVDVVTVDLSLDIMQRIEGRGVARQDACCAQNDTP